MCSNRSVATAVWCGYCYENLRGRANHRGHLRCRRRRGVNRDQRTMALRKPVADAQRLDGGDGGAGGDLAILFPTLFEYVTNGEWDDGSGRQTSSLLLFFEDGLFKVCLNDRALGRTCWATGRSAEGAVMSLEGALASGSNDWRKSKHPSGRRN